MRKKFTPPLNFCKKLNYKSLLAIALLTFTLGCRKDLNVQNSDVPVTTESRLVLSKSNFESIYKDLKKNKKHPELTSNFNNSLKDFALKKSEKSLEDEIGKQVFNSKPAVKDLSNSSKTNSTNYSVDSTVLYSAIINELIEDDPLKTLINKSGEILVDNVIYKVTPFGVLYASKDKETELDNVYKKLLSQNDILIRINNPSKKINFTDVEVNVQSNLKSSQGISYNAVKENLYQGSLEVSFIDTFNQYDTLIDPSDNGGGYYGGGSGSGVVTQPDLDPYSNMSNAEISFKSGIGSFFETIFTNSTKYNYFDDDYRVSVLLYDRNYGLLKTLGLKVKLQKKGWLWWNKTDAEEIRAGWERIVYEQANDIPQITRPGNQPVINLGNSYISPFEAPAYGWFTSNVTTAYKWHFAHANQNLFSIEVPYYLVPNADNNLVIPLSQFKSLVNSGIDALNRKWGSSVPMSASNDPQNYKFPVYDISDGSITYLSINDIKKFPKSFHSEPESYNNSFSGGKFRTYLSPFEQVETNTDIIDIPLDFSTATISLNSNLNSPLSIGSVFNSLGVSGLDNSYKVLEADIYGTVKHNGRWLGIRTHVIL
jgi:hypothetical protein